MEAPTSSLRCFSVADAVPPSLLAEARRAATLVSHTSAAGNARVNTGSSSSSATAAAASSSVSARGAERGDKAAAEAQTLLAALARPPWDANSGGDGGGEEGMTADAQAALRAWGALPPLERLRAACGPAAGADLHATYVRRPRALLSRAAQALGAAVAQRWRRHEAQRRGRGDGTGETASSPSTDTADSSNVTNGGSHLNNSNNNNNSSHHHCSPEASLAVHVEFLPQRARGSTSGAPPPPQNTVPALLRALDVVAVVSVRDTEVLAAAAAARAAAEARLLAARAPGQTLRSSLHFWRCAARGEAVPRGWEGVAPLGLVDGDSPIAAGGALSMAAAGAPNSALLARLGAGDSSGGSGGDNNSIGGGGGAVSDVGDLSGIARVVLGEAAGRGAEGTAATASTADVSRAAAARLVQPPALMAERPPPSLAAPQSLLGLRALLYVTSSAVCYVAWPLPPPTTTTTTTAAAAAEEEEKKEKAGTEDTGVAANASGGGGGGRVAKEGRPDAPAAEAVPPSASRKRPRPAEGNEEERTAEAPVVVLPLESKLSFTRGLLGL